jgi:hypothetical protein
VTTLLALILASARPVATCLVAGGLKTLYDYQAAPHWTPALIDGGITALLLAGTMLGGAGVASGVQKASMATKAASAARNVPPVTTSSSGAPPAA